MVKCNYNYNVNEIFCRLSLIVKFFYFDDYLQTLYVEQKELGTL